LHLKILCIISLVVRGVGKSERHNGLGNIELRQKMTEIVLQLLLSVGHFALSQTDEIADECWTGSLFARDGFFSAFENSESALREYAEVLATTVQQ